MRYHLLGLLCLALVLVTLPCVVNAQGAQPAVLPTVTFPAQTADFSLIDSHALAAPQDAQQSIALLAAYLIKGTSNDKEKARAIFTWVANNVNYDYDSVATGKWEQRPEFVLQQRCTDCLGRSRLFESLAHSAGLEAVVIGGNGKSLEVSSTPGTKYETVTPSGVVYDSHSWNAVKIDGKWQLIDVTWAGGGSKRNGKIEPTGPIDPYYFLVPPSEMIYTHFPNEDKWQLLDKPKTKAEQERLPMLSNGFFKYGIGLLSHTESTIQINDHVAVTMTAASGIAMCAELRQGGQKIEGQCVFSQRGAKSYEFYAVPPGPGTYILRILARPVDQPNAFWKCVNDYKVEAKSGKPGSALPFVWDNFQTKGCYLVSPSSGVLESGKPQLFTISLPGATSAGVQTGGQIILLEKQGNLFGGYVTLVPGDVLITACYPERPDWNSGMVRYLAH